MAYADALDQVDPSQAEKAKLGAGRIRSLAAAVRQRLGSVFVDVDADPLTLKPSTVGASALADNAVDTAAIVDAAVTTAKIADTSIEIAKLSATARGLLTKVQVVGTVAFTLLTPPLVAGGKIWGSVIYTSATLGFPLLAYWKVTPAASLFADTVQQGCLLTAIARGNEMGVLVYNASPGTLNLTGYSIELAMLVAP